MQCDFVAMKERRPSYHYSASILHSSFAYSLSPVKAIDLVSILGHYVSVKRATFVKSTEKRRPFLCQADVPQATVEMKRVHVMLNGVDHMLLLNRAV